MQSVRNGLGEAGHALPPPAWTAGGLAAVRAQRGRQQSVRGGPVLQNGAPRRRQTGRRCCGRSSS